MKRFLIVLAALLMSAALLAGCGGDSETRQPANGDTAGGGDADGGPAVGARTFTLEELAEFDGKDGRPAYVAVDGVVYDVTGSSEWPEGDHAPCDLDAAAGRDLSEVLELAPARMRALIEAMPVVGTLEQEVSTSGGGRVITAAELAVCNGQNGNPAYVAVDGVVYDVTSSQHWHNGHHHDCPFDCMAGQDLSELITRAPARMRASLESFPVVGTYAP